MGGKFDAMADSDSRVPHDYSTFRRQSQWWGFVSRILDRQVVSFFGHQWTNLSDHSIAVESLAIGQTLLRQAMNIFVDDWFVVFGVCSLHTVANLVIVSIVTKY